VSLISPIANALAIPVVTFGVVPFALCAIVVPLDLPWQIAHAVFAALMVALDSLAATPAAAWQQHAPPAWAVVLALGGVALLVAPRGVPGRVLGGIALLPLFVVQPTPPDPGTFRMTVLDVGQGLAVVVQTHDHALLYDTGPRYHEEADAGGRIVAPFLRALGIRHLDAIIITHQDTDHSGGALSLLATVPVDLLLSSLAQGHPILARRALDHEVAARCEAGQRWSWDDVRFTVLQPTAALYAVPQRKANDLSCVLRIDSRHGSVLLTGDVEARGEQISCGAMRTCSRRMSSWCRTTAAARRPRRPSSPRWKRSSRSTRPAIAIGLGIRGPTSLRVTKAPAPAAIARISTVRSRSPLRRKRRSRRAPGASTTAATGARRRPAREQKRSTDMGRSRVANGG
jgi:beta-lactamase superfamily II metal-dependent hydrolase